MDFSAQDAPEEGGRHRVLASLIQNGMTMCIRHRP